KAAKLGAEEEAREVLDALEIRIDRALDLVTELENRRHSQSMRFWSILTAIIAILGVAATVLASLLVRLL
ncbi:MAG: hypothetical protein ACT4PT_07550, partial [Methanobacteriota archaeon]